MAFFCKKRESGLNQTKNENKKARFIDES